MPYLPSLFQIRQSSDLEQFLRQPFVGSILGLMCFFGVLLILVVAALIWVRRRRAAQAKLNAPPSSPGYYTTPVSGEMPDLDSLVGPRDSAAPSAPAQQPVVPQAPVPVRPTRKGAYNVALKDGDTVEAIEVMAILRDVLDGKLVIQMGDKAYQNVANDPEFKERFTKIMRELAQIVSTGKAAPLPVSSVETAHELPPEPKAELPVESAVPPAPKPAAPRPSVPLPAAPGGQMPGDLPSFSIDDQEPLTARKRGQKREVKPVPEINIAGAIEAYLQHKLRHTPEYSARSIHIYPSPEGGVSIEVDGQYFDAVGDITDDEVREFLAATIQEWQDRH